MENLHLWIAISFIYPLFYGFSNIIDGQLINKTFKNPVILIFFASLTNILFLPLILFWGTPTLPSLGMMFCYFLLALLDFVYLLPYYAALKKIDTSIVGALFSLGRVLIPVMTFIFLGERLQISQYWGFALIIITSVLLSIKNLRLPKINAAFYLMLLSSSIRSVFSVLEKYTINADGNWINMVIYPAVISNILVPLFILLTPRLRTEAAETFPRYKKNIGLFISTELLGFTASSVMFFILPHISAVLKTSISATMPIFILLTGVILHRFFHININEDIAKKDVYKKLVLFIIMIYGVNLVIGL